MKIRKAKISDVKQITKLRKDNLRKVDSEKYFKKVVDFLIKRDTDKRNLEHIKQRDYFCLVDENKILGTISLDKKEIYDLFVKANYTKKGIGLKLIKHIEKIAKKKEIKKLWLESAQHSKGFYEKAGFKIKKKIDKGNNRINFLMEKILK